MLLLHRVGLATDVFHDLFVRSALRGETFRELPSANGSGCTRSPVSRIEVLPSLHQDFRGLGKESLPSVAPAHKPLVTFRVSLLGSFEVLLGARPGQAEGGPFVRHVGGTRGRRRSRDHLANPVEMLGGGHPAAFLA